MLRRKGIVQSNSLDQICKGQFFFGLLKNVFFALKYGREAVEEIRKINFLIEQLRGFSDDYRPLSGNQLHEQVNTRLKGFNDLIF